MINLTLNTILFQCRFAFLFTLFLGVCVGEIESFFFDTTLHLNQAESKVVINHPVASYLKRLTPHQVKYSASSTQKGFDPKNLNAELGWKAWGSVISDRYGAWLKAEFDQIYFVDWIHFVPGDERELDYYKKCGRPSKIIVRNHQGEEREIQLPNQRQHQTILFSPPFLSRSLTFEFKNAYGPSVHAGICMAAFSVFVHQNPLESILGLKAKVERLFHLLRSTESKYEAFEEIQNLGELMVPWLLKALLETSTEDQGRIIEALGYIQSPFILEEIRSYKTKIHPLNTSIFNHTLASLGDPKAIQDLISNLDLLPVVEQAKRLSILARSRDRKLLPLLLKYFGH